MTSSRDAAPSRRRVEAASSSDRPPIRRDLCTYFDHRYLEKGLALYRSLEEHGGNFRLFVLCLTPVAEAALAELAPERVVVVPLAELEAADPGLLVAGDVPLDPIPSAGPVEWVAPVDQRLGIAEERAHRVEVARRERPQGQPLGLDRRRSGAVGHRLKLAGSAWCEA